MIHNEFLGMLYVPLDKLLYCAILEICFRCQNIKQPNTLTLKGELDKISKFYLHMNYTCYI